MQAIGQHQNDLVRDSIVTDQKAQAVAWDMSLAFKSMNVFRGILPSRTPVLSTQAGIKYHNFVLGFYGGSAFGAGSPAKENYTETDLILMYYKPTFNIQAQWYYNFTVGVTHIKNPNGFFDFNPQTSIAILDVIVEKKLAKNVTLTSSTLLFGRDRVPVQEDIDAGIQLLRGRQRYSQYFAVSQYKKWEGQKVEWHVGGSFSWSDFDGQTLYASKPGFTDLGVSYSRDLFPAKPLHVPIKASLYVNTVTNNVFLVATIAVVQLTKLQ